VDLAHWTFLSNHAHVLVCIARDPDARVREIAQQVGITERAVHRILADLEQGAVIERVRQGRRTHYLVHLSRPLRHPLECGRTVGDLLRMLLDAPLQLASGGHG
jgi:DNA-binding MarR family transcriptional regulator